MSSCMKCCVLQEAVIGPGGTAEISCSHPNIQTVLSANTTNTISKYHKYYQQIPQIPPTSIKKYQQVPTSISKYHKYYKNNKYQIDSHLIPHVLPINTTGTTRKYFFLVLPNTTGTTR